jgi:hypothetical protein
VSRHGYVYLRFPGGSDKQHKRMERATTDYAFRLYLYDALLIEYAREGSTLIHGHESGGSLGFIRHHTGMDLHHCLGVYFLSLPDGRTVQFQRKIELDSNDEPITGRMPRQRLVLNQAEYQRRLAQLRKFKRWYDMMILLHPARPTRRSDKNILHCLNDEDYSIDLLCNSYSDIKKSYLSVQDPNLYEAMPIPDSVPFVKHLCHCIVNVGVTS